MAGSAGLAGEWGNGTCQNLCQALLTPTQLHAYIDAVRAAAVRTCPGTSQAAHRCLICGPPRVVSMRLSMRSQLILSNISSTLADLAQKSARLPKGVDLESSMAKPPGLISAAIQTQPLPSSTTFWVSSTP